AADERDFLKNHLGPAMAQAGLRDVNIMVWDHNRDLIIERALTIFGDSAAAKYAWGMGFHWYEDWSGGTQMYGNVALVHRPYPDTDHCSNFIRPVARRIVAAPNRSMLLATAFVNPNGTVAVVVMNPTSKGGDYNLVVGATSVQINSRPHSIQTVTF